MTLAPQHNFTFPSIPVFIPSPLSPISLVQPSLCSSNFCRSFSPALPLRCPSIRTFATKTCSRLPPLISEELCLMSDSNTRRRMFLRPLNALLALILGIFSLPILTNAFRWLVVAGGADQVDKVITGAFLPLVGILFAIFSGTAVSSLRQRQQDLRDFMHQELALIRMLFVMVKDQAIVRLLLQYTVQLDAETFSHQQNGISYDHEVPGTRAAMRREEIFAEAEETLWQCFGIANELRLRGEVEEAIRRLVEFRTKRRAVLDSGLPGIHFVIVKLLGASMLLAFVLLVVDEHLAPNVWASRLFFGVLVALMTLTQALITDLREPFGGDYGVTPWRLYRTVELLQGRLRKEDEDCEEQEQDNARKE